MQVSMKIDDLSGARRKLDEIGQNISNTAPLIESGLH
jgi:hypothetical protein